MDSQLLPAVADVTTELAGLVSGLLFCFEPTSIHQLPDFVGFPLRHARPQTFIVRWFGLAATGPSTLDFWFGFLVLADEMLHKIVFTVAYMVAVLDVAFPPFEVAMTLIFMTYPVCFAFERLGLRAMRKSASKGLNVFVNVFGPVRRFMEFLDFETQRALELGR